MRALPVVLLLFALSGCGSRRPNSVRVDPALASLVPGNTVLLAGVNFDALRKTPAYQKLGSDSLLVLLGANGFDLKNVWEALLASDGTRTALLARGKFSDSGLEPEISRHGAARTRYKGYTLTNLGETALTFLNPSTALAGKPDAVRAIIDQRGNSTGPPSLLAAEIAAIPPENQLWIAGSAAPGQLAALAPRAGNLANLGTALRLVERFRAAADLRSGIKLSAVAVAPNDRDAESLAGALQAFLALARMSSGHDAGIRAATEAVRIEQQQRTVRIDANLPEALLDRLAGSAHTFTPE